jgi:hypothetical protein
MGSTIYSQKVKHPVYVTYECEHCGHVNSFSQEIIGNASAEVSFGSSNKRTQQKIGNLGQKAESDLERQVLKARSDTNRDRYSWLKFHKCEKCKFTQSWQKGRLWKRSSVYLVLDFFLVLILFSWLTGSSLESKTSGAWGGFLFFVFVGLIPILMLVLPLRKIDKSKQTKPTVVI